MFLLLLEFLLELLLISVNLMSVDDIHSDINTRYSWRLREVKLWICFFIFNSISTLQSGWSYYNAGIVLSLICLKPLMSSYCLWNKSQTTHQSLQYSFPSQTSLFLLSLVCHPYSHIPCVYSIRLFHFLRFIKPLSHI